MKGACPVPAITPLDTHERELREARDLIAQLQRELERARQVIAEQQLEMQRWCSKRRFVGRIR